MAGQAPSAAIHFELPVYWAMISVDVEIILCAECNEGFAAEMLRISLLGDLRFLYISSREEKLHYSATQSMLTAHAVL
jgi:hypothetical protein